MYTAETKKNIVNFNISFHYCPVKIILATEIGYS